MSPRGDDIIIVEQNESGDKVVLIPRVNDIDLEVVLPVQPRVDEVVGDLYLYWRRRNLCEDYDHFINLKVSSLRRLERELVGLVGSESFRCEILADLCLVESDRWAETWATRRVGQFQTPPLIGEPCTLRGRDVQIYCVPSDEEVLVVGGLPISSIDVDRVGEFVYLILDRDLL